MIKLVEYNSISRWFCKKCLCQRAKDRKKRIFSLCFEWLQKFKRVRKLFKLEDEEIGFTFKEKKEKRNQSDKQSTAKFSYHKILLENARFPGIGIVVPKIKIEKWRKADFVAGSISKKDRKYLKKSAMFL